MSDPADVKDFVNNLLGEHRRPKSVRADGRRCAIAVIDALMSDADNIKDLYDGLQTELQANPVAFMREIVMPASQRILKEDDDGNVEPETVVRFVLPDNGRSANSLSPIEEQRADYHPHCIKGEDPNE